MDTTELKRRIENAGCKVRFARTGSPDWDRGFILSDGVTIGRAVIYKGEYQHIKWYTNTASFLRSSVEVSVCMDKVMLDIDYTELEARALAVQQADLKEKLEWRDAHPKFDRLGKPAKRKTLTGRDKDRILAELIRVTYGLPYM